MIDRVITPFEETKSKLASYHPIYKQSISDGLWYFDVRFLKQGSHGAASGIDLQSIDIEPDTRDINQHGYWLPKSAVCKNILDRSIDQINRLKVVEEGQMTRNFDKFHSAFDVKLANREINDTVRISEFSAEKLLLQKATYLDQVGTNISADTVISVEDTEWQKTPRQLDTLKDGSIKNFEDAICANTIGVCGLFVDRDWKVLTALRKLDLNTKADTDVTKRLGAMEKGWHCFSSGVLQWKDIEQKNKNFKEGFLDGLRIGLEREIEEETGIKRSDGLYDIVPYAFAREIKRPGKPQFFFLVHFQRHSADQIFSVVNVNINAGRASEESEYAARKPNLLMSLFTSKKRRRVRLLDEDLRYMDKRMLDQLSHEMVDDFSFTYELYASILLYINAKPVVP